MDGRPIMLLACSSVFHELDHHSAILQPSLFDRGASRIQQILAHRHQFKVRTRLAFQRLRFQPFEYSADRIGQLESSYHSSRWMAELYPGDVGTDGWLNMRSVRGDAGKW